MTSKKYYKNENPVGKRIDIKYLQGLSDDLAKYEIKGIIKNTIVDTLSYKTISANAKTVDKHWVLVDADSVPLGRVASVVALHIRGKHKTNFTPHVDCGDNVIVINADKVSLSGNKWKQKV